MKIENTTLDGLKAVQIETAAFRLLVVTQVGPRIAWFSKPDSANLLYWSPEAVRRGDWRLYGGHRVWLTRPLADESEDTYLTDNEPCTLTLLPDGLDACAPASPGNHIARGMEIRVLSETSVQVRNYLRNEGTMLYSGGCWSPTCVVADKPIEIQLGSPEADPTWDIVYMAIPRVFAGNVTMLADDSVALSGDTLVLTPKGRCVKRCVRAEKGTILLRCNGYVFRKTAPFNPDSRYPMNGCNIAAYIGDNNWMAEMETFGGEREIKPGQTIDNTEKWELVADPDRI